LKVEQELFCKQTNQYLSGIGDTRKQADVCHQRYRSDHGSREVGDVRRFESPRQIQKLAGLSLRENSSEKHKGQTTISKRGRSKLRAVLFNAAIPLIAKNPEFKSLHEYYTTRANNPLKKKQSVIAIRFKLIRVFYAILANGVTYDPQKMFSDIHRQHKKNNCEIQETSAEKC